MTRQLASSPEYLVLTHGSRLGTTSWTGAVVIGKEAIYVLKESTGVVMGRGVIGQVFKLVDAVAARVLRARDLPGVPYTDIPPSVRNHPGWPIREAPEHPVLIIPRAAISLIHHTRGAHEVALELAETPVAIQWGQFGGSKIKDFLAMNDWPLRWSGDLYNITEADAFNCSKPRQPRVATLAFGVALLLALLSMSYVMWPWQYQHRFSVVIGFLWAATFIVGLFGAAALRRGV